MRRRRKYKKQRKIILVSTVGLLCIMTAGYAAFQTNLNINAKGNIIEKEITVQELRDVYCNQTTGDGLYKDTYEEGRCIYKGLKPNNFILFNNELWRIISIETDNVIKIRKHDSIGKFAYDKGGSRYQSNGYCNLEENKTSGCNVWGSKTTMMDSDGNKITQLMPLSGTTKLELPSTEASLNNYLNGEYYNQLSDEAKSQIITYRWNVGQINLKTGQTLVQDIEQEKQNKWDGKVALINASDYIKSSTNPNCKSLITSRLESFPCQENWQYTMTWTISSGYTQQSVWHVAGSSALGHSLSNLEINIHPAIYINKDITLSGEGTQSNPYTIK